MKKLAEWRIKTKKDWILAFLFTALMVYVAAVRFFHWKILNFMQKFMPDKMSTMNLPEGYGTVLAGFLIADCALGGFRCWRFPWRGSRPRDRQS